MSAIPWLSAPAPQVGTKSLSAISIRSFVLGQVFGLSSLSFVYLLRPSDSNPLWRLPFFICCLSIFHFLEFYITATYNAPKADSTSFLLSSNGSAYNIAHSIAATECVVSHLFFSEAYSTRPALLFGGEAVRLSLGIILIVVGQAVRSWAMIDAGTNFSHQVQQTHQEGHTLVTTGVFRWLRHPSYFGFFWWAIGTQLVMGNVLGLVGYCAVLVRFFAARIEREWPFFPFPLTNKTRSLLADSAR